MKKLLPLLLLLPSLARAQITGGDPPPLSASPTFSGLTVAGVSSFAKDVQAVGSTVTFNSVNLALDWSLGPTLTVLSTANVTATTWSNMAGRGRYILELIQDGTGSHTMTWPTSIDWPAKAAPTLTTTAGARDYFMFYYGLDGRIHCLAEALNN